MSKLNCLKTLLALFLVLGVFTSVSAQCFPEEVVTSAYATGGDGQYKSEILWFTWGSDDANQYPYGRDNEDLQIGSKSFASIDLGLDTYLCVEMEITNIESVGSLDSAIASYRSGNFEGDSFDKLYNIGGINEENQLIAGIVNKNDAGRAVVSVSAKAWLDGIPYKLKGLVIADAESLNGTTETTYATASGEWTVIEVRKNEGAGVYRVRKRTIDESTQEFRFVQGNDQNTAAITFLKFNDAAYGDFNDAYPIQFSVDLKGGGKQAFAIGLVPGAIDLGDAPSSYGDAIHLLNDLIINSDGIIATTDTEDTENNTVDLNTADYSPGGLAHESIKYLGSIAPDADTETMYSIKADGDDLTGAAGPQEEDAWPLALREVNLSDVDSGNSISATILYNAGEADDIISGWIDFDGNGVFDDYEMQSATVTSAGDGSVNLEWTVPNNPDISKGRFYVRLRYFDKNVPIVQRIPTGIVELGEAEDHVIYFPCYKSAKEGVGLNTEVGISALGRDAFNEDNWPQIRKSAWLALESRTKGFVPNRLSTAQRDSIPQNQLVEGMMIYNTTIDCLQIYVGEEAQGGWHCFKQQTCPLD